MAIKHTISVSDSWQMGESEEGSHGVSIAVEGGVVSFKAEDTGDEVHMLAFTTEEWDYIATFVAHQLRPSTMGGRE